MYGFHHVDGLESTQEVTTTTMNPLLCKVKVENPVKTSHLAVALTWVNWIFTNQRVHAVGVIPDTVVEGFGVKLRISFRCPIFVSTFMFIFIYLFPYFGGDRAALVFCYGSS